MSFLSLFTTAGGAEQPRSGGGVADAIRRGADRSGARFDYLLKTAQRESSLDPNAKASTSSATGLFQFIEQTWLGVVKAEGGKHGLQRYADAIATTAGGRLTVSDPALRSEILALRKDPAVSAAMAGELARRNGEALAGALGRQPRDGELYLAHVMGARGAAALIARADAAPNAAAARYFPEEAAANRAIFYNRDGGARSLAEVRSRLTDGFAQGAAAAAADQADASTSSASASAPVWLSYFAAPPADGAQARPLDSLFSTTGARAPLSPAVTAFWSAAAPAALDQYFAADQNEPLGLFQLARAAGAGSSRPGPPLDLGALMKRPAA